jgi:hypothetical protein
MLLVAAVVLLAGSTAAAPEPDEKQCVQAAQSLLVAGANPNLPGLTVCGGLFTQSPLHAAVSNNLVPMAELLLEAGAVPDEGTRLLWGLHRQSPLARAVANERMVALLLKHGANPNIYVGGSHVLIAAIRIGNVNVVKHLLKRGVNPNQREYSLAAMGSFSAIGVAADLGHTRIVDLLLAHGADPADGLTFIFGLATLPPSVLAQHAGHCELASHLRVALLRQP